MRRCWVSVDATLRYKILFTVEDFELNCRRSLWVVLVSVLALDIGGANIKAADGLARPSHLLSTDRTAVSGPEIGADHLDCTTTRAPGRDNDGRVGRLF